MPSFPEAVVTLASEAVRTSLSGADTSPEQILLTTIGPSAALTAQFFGPSRSFVTLQRDGKLRGCIGNLEYRRSLYYDIIRNARRAMADPRLSPIEPSEWEDLHIEVSLLEDPIVMEETGFDALYAALEPGVDGLTLRQGQRRATFLPTVWRSLPEPEQFVGALLRKGGWADDAWPEGIRIERYRTDNYDSPPPRPALTVAPAGAGYPDDAAEPERS